MINQIILFGVSVIPLLLQGMDDRPMTNPVSEPAKNIARPLTRNRKNNKLYKMDIDYIIHHDAPKPKIKKRTVGERANRTSQARQGRFINTSFWSYCVECGKLFVNSSENFLAKQLQKHLSSRHDYTPEESQEEAFLHIKNSSKMKTRTTQTTDIKWHVASNPKELLVNNLTNQ